MIKHTEPYLHYVIENFLPAKQFQQLTGIYSHLQFIEKESDLFHFYQTNELAKESSLDFFKKELSGKFKEITSMKDTSYNIFASYYFKGNYLLCHDDVVQDRKFAFSYYLEDHASGELVLYDNTATKVVKKVKVKKNLLVIFEVSNISYHEVALTKTDGRKAVTGWLNQKGQGAKRPTKVIPPYQPILPSDLIKFKFPHDISTEEYYNFPGVQYQFNVEEKTMAGPFYERKVWRLKLSQNVVIDLKGHSLISADFLKFQKGHYLLLNDPVNSLGDDILDVFILQEPNGHHEGEFIRIINEAGDVQGTIDYNTDTMFVVQRGKKNYYIGPVEKEINLAHLIYRKTKPKKQKTAQLTKKNIREVRKQLASKKHEKLQAILAGKAKGGKSKQIEKKTVVGRGRRVAGR